MWRTQSAVLPVLSGWVLVLLKLLLATVSAGTGTQGSAVIHVVSIPTRCRTSREYAAFICLHIVTDFDVLQPLEQPQLPGLPLWTK